MTYNFVDGLIQNNLYWLHKLCLFCKESTEFHFRANSWTKGGGFLTDSKRMIKCCHPLNQKTLKLQYAGLFPFVDQDLEAKGLKGIEVEAVRMFSKKVNSSVAFKSEPNYGYFHPLTNEWIGQVGAVSYKKLIE